MDRALFWAERGRGLTSPNPPVGAVLISASGVVIGQGAHLIAGGPHAEIVALDKAGSDARGATLYCTLEPCAHTGRTGPCVERIVAAGVRRVVAAVTDPNPRVSGQGFAYLEAHDVAVTTGVAQAEAGRQLAPFFTWVARRRPFVTVKAAASLDGFVGRSDARVKLTGATADRYFHRQRAEVDAIAIGSGTLLIDDPMLTARGAFRARPLTRVIVDWRGRAAASAQVFSTLQAGPVIMVVTAETLAGRPEHFAALERRGVVVQPFESRDLRLVLEWLAARDVVSLLVEGGPTLHAALADAELVDRAQWIVTPRTLGRGVPLASNFTQTVAPTGPPRVVQLGEDLLIEFDVHRIDRDHRPH